MSQVGNSLLGICSGAVTIWTDDGGDPPVYIEDDCNCLKGYVDAPAVMREITLPTKMTFSGHYESSFSIPSPGYHANSFSLTFTRTVNRVPYVEGGTLNPGEFWIRVCKGCCDSGPPIFDVYPEDVEQTVSISDPDDGVITPVHILIGINTQILPVYAGAGGCDTTTFQMINNFIVGFPIYGEWLPGPGCPEGSTSPGGSGLIGRDVNVATVDLADLVATWDSDPTYNIRHCNLPSGQVQTLVSHMTVEIFDWPLYLP